MKSLIADTAIYLIQVHGDKNGRVCGESACYAHRRGRVMFRRDDGLQHDSSQLETAASTRDSINLVQKTIQPLEATSQLSIHSLCD